jgi:hypothetical protein
MDQSELIKEIVEAYNLRDSALLVTSSLCLPGDLSGALGRD